LENFDAIVIGAGSAGLPCAYYLAVEGLRVLVVDRNPSAGQGENKAAIGGARATHSEPAKIRLCLESLTVFSSLKDEHGFDVDWKKGGYCFPVYTESNEAALKSLLPVQRKFELDIDWVAADRIRELVPGINPEGLRGGTFSPDDGQVSPLLVAASFHALSVARGVKFAFGEEVVEIARSGGRITGLRTQKNAYSSPVVVNAAGPGAGEVGRLSGLDVPVTPDGHEGGISAPVEHFLQPLVVDLRPGPEGRSANFYFGQKTDGQIIFCYTPAPVIPGTDKRSTSEFMPVIGRRLIELIPRLKNLLIRRTWRGLYPMTPDGVPILGKVEEQEGMFLAAGTCGQGFMMGPGIGRNIASVVTTGKPLMEQSVFDTMSFRRDFGSAKVEALK
jgi:sarcosine oxidase subunit beta